MYSYYNDNVITYAGTYILTKLSLEWYRKKILPKNKSFQKRYSSIRSSHHHNAGIDCYFWLKGKLSVEMV